MDGTKDLLAAETSQKEHRKIKISLRFLAFLYGQLWDGLPMPDIFKSLPQDPDDLRSVSAFMAIKIQPLADPDVTLQTRQTQRAYCALAWCLFFCGQSDINTLDITK